MQDPITRLIHLHSTDWSAVRCDADDGRTFVWIGDGACAFYVDGADITTEALNTYQAERAEPEQRADAYTRLCQSMPGSHHEEVPPEIALQVHRHLNHEHTGWRCVAERYGRSPRVYPTRADFDQMCLDKFSGPPVLFETDRTGRLSDGRQCRPGALSPRIVLEPVYRTEDRTTWGW